MEIVVYKFEELPALIEKDVQFGSYTGLAEVRVDRDNDWTIVSVEIVGKRKNATGTWDDVLTRFEPGDDLFRLLSGVIYQHFKDDVDEMVGRELGVLEDAA